jgi:hypothetical protein
MGQRVDELLARLRKGAGKTAEILGSLSDAQWQQVLYAGPPAWTVRDMLAHFLSAEVALLRGAQDVAAGSCGAPEGFDYDAFNASEQARLANVAPAELLARLAAAREATFVWTAGLDEADLDRVGRHPALGEITLEAHLNAIYMK